MAYCQVNGIKLYYEWHGSEAAFPVVFVNGLTSDTASWTFQVPAFAPHFRVLLYDCRGQGQSDKPLGPYSTAFHAYDLLALLDALGIHQAHIVGLSNGGAVAMHLAAGHPDRVARLVLADTLVRVDAVLQATLASWLAALDAGGPLLRLEVATPWVWGREFLENDTTILPTLRDKAAGADPDALRALIRGLQGFDIRDRLESIQAPTMVLVGEEDVLTPLRHARALSEAIPNAQLVTVANAGHILMIEQPEVFNILTLGFLQEQ